MPELDPSTFRPETRALHAGQKPDTATNARAVPIYRLSVGLEHVDDLIADLEQALAVATADNAADGSLVGAAG